MDAGARHRTCALMSNLHELFACSETEPHCQGPHLCTRLHSTIEDLTAAKVRSPLLASALMLCGNCRGGCESGCDLGSGAATHYTGCDKAAHLRPHKREHQLGTVVHLQTTAPKSEANRSRH